MGLRIGVDIGGSFTDFAVLDESNGTVRSLKVFSRPDAPGREVADGMRMLGERYGIDPAEVVHFTHGTTVGVNAVVQRKGIRLGLITNRYFEDVLVLARLKTPDMYHLMSSRPEPLVPRYRTFGIDGRLDAEGKQLEPVDAASVREAVAGLKRTGCEGVVISLLHAYRNPEHERQVRAIVAETAPELFVSCASEVWPIIREYERTNTAVIGGYVQPVVSNYLTSLQEALRHSGVTADLKVTKSNGGVMSAERGKTDCVQIVLSGTASGVIGAAWVAQLCDLKNVMSLDIGGTTADVALIAGGEPQYATGEYIGDHQIHIPSVSVTSIGDGGGSIARVDPFGVLKVGPESAGSTPGPVCYGRGGREPTITDAFAAIGVLGQTALGYDSVRLDVAAAREAIAPLAARLGESIEAVAEAIINVSISGMYSGISRLISRFGIDPREFALMAFGGAGPMLACHLARALNMERITVPLTPGVLSALGGLIADTRNDFVAVAWCALGDEEWASLERTRQALEQEAIGWVRAEVGAMAQPELTYTAEMRYQGQSFEIETAFDAEAMRTKNLAALREAFHQAHERLYRYRDEAAVIQVVALRVVAKVRTPRPVLTPVPDMAEPAKPAAVVPCWMDGAMRQMPLYRRDVLRAGDRFVGPAIIAQDDTTTCVLPDFEVNVDRWGNLHIINLAAAT
ncbi:hydantoinase/oxoprolinase family protein [Bradyrhizobium manausense]|uniref:hydantoinase/oxoprolinase family protein n=1 Tax=Bradyrhizobium manausense TaxID=989370 RepID=UPI001BAC3B96|nr:hydantoinase/oxoprolinase family protein [Bradyrhizobium manausense]MBR0724650.1 hydantoinase/oxoprolinase family protein [Bradyrhizobium manausense]